MKLLSKTLLLALTFGVLASADAADDKTKNTWELERKFQSGVKLEEFRQIPVQEGGRRKPIDTMARETVFEITGRTRFQGLDPVYVLLSWAYEFPKWQNRRCIEVRNLKVIDLFLKHGQFDQKRRPGDRLYVSPRDFQTNVYVQRLYAIALNKQRNKQPTELEETECLAISEKMFRMRSAGVMLRIVPVSDNVGDKWQTISRSDRSLFSALQKTEGKLVDGFRKSDAATINASLESLAAQLRAYDFKVWPYYGLLELEYTMNTYHPFQLAQVIYLFSIIFFITGFFGVDWAPKFAFGTFCFAAFIHCAALTGRGFLVSRAPVASLYETLVFMTGFASVMALVLEGVFKKEGNFALSAACLSMFGLFLGDTIPDYAEHQAISPLVPVLRSYWLNIHVTCMIASYGACLLAAGMGFNYAFRACYNGCSKDIFSNPEMETLELYIYRSIQVAFLLLTVGIILGGVWANQSWGRYWDWDPKETWAFITWVVYAAYLHLRFIGWARGLKAAAMAMIGFWFVMFTYLGVSYILPGLHSYVPAGDLSLSRIAPFVVIPAGLVAFFFGLNKYGQTRLAAK